MDQNRQNPSSETADFKIASEKFNSRAEKFKLIFNASPDMIFILSYNGQVLDANHAALETYEYEHETLFGMNYEKLLTTENSIKKARKLFESVKRGNEIDYEWMTRTRSGKEILVDIRLRSLRLSDDEDKSAVVLILRDISMKQKADEAINSLARATNLMEFDAFLKESVRTLAQLYGTRYAFAGRLLPDKAHVRTLVVWAEGQFVDNFTYSLEGTPCKEIMDLDVELIPDSASERYPDDEMLVQMGIQSYFGHPMIAEGKMIGLVSVMDDKPLAVEEWAGPILGLFANRLALEIERYEVNQELQANKDNLERLVQVRTQALQDSNHELESFCYSVSHDLRAPLRSIEGFSRAVIEDCGGQLDQQGKDYLQRVRKATKHMGGLIDGLLELSRLGRAELQRMNVDLCVMANDVITGLRQGDPGRNVIFKCEINKKISADPILMRLVVQNLIGNAWKYTGRESSALIEFGVKNEAEETVYFVRDNGAGFDMCYSDKLFGVFQRLHRESEFEGTGIGLATVQRIIVRHGGRIWADADLDQGATFFFTL